MGERCLWFFFQTDTWTDIFDSRVAFATDFFYVQGGSRSFWKTPGFPKSVNDQISKFVLFHLQNRTNNIKFVTSDILSLLCQCQCPVGPDLILSRQPKLSHDNIPGSQPPDKGYNTERIWAWDPHTAPPMRACIGYMGIYVYIVV